MLLRAQLGLAVAVASLCLAATALGQNAPPDLVELTNGGMVRGTIIENIPGDHVTIQLPTGETRRFGRGEVRAAGRAPEGPPAPPPPPQAPYAPQGYGPPPQSYGQPPGYAQPPILQPDLVTLHVVSNGSNRVTLHRLTGTSNFAVYNGYGAAVGAVDAYAPVCTAPCEAQLPRGTYQFGLAGEEGRPRRADHALFTIQQETGLQVEYSSREGLRVAGWVTFAITSLAYCFSPLALLDENSGLAVFGVASLIWLIALIPEFIMIFMQDHADIREIGPSGAQV